MLQMYVCCDIMLLCICCESMHVTITIVDCESIDVVHQCMLRYNVAFDVLNQCTLRYDCICASMKLQINVADQFIFCGIMLRCACCESMHVAIVNPCMLRYNVTLYISEPLKPSHC